MGDRIRKRDRIKNVFKSVFKKERNSPQRKTELEKAKEEIEALKTRLIELEQSYQKQNNEINEVIKHNVELNSKN